ncbi:MAG: 30S ribosomal protein S5 [Candidatus Wildermuthbacteria bacterium]|nr:30S ribosomal protein S5 [Candidatus Wildermuthbacteria bacterium]
MKDDRRFKTRQRQEKPSEFDSKLVDLARVTRVAAGGRKMRFRAVVVAGDRKERVGVGVAKGLDVSQAVEKATKKAQQSLIVVPIIRETIGHEVEATFGASHVLLKPQTMGRGLVAGGVTRIICEKAGIKNISAKLLSRSRNKLNNAMATILALRKLQAIVKKESVEQPAAKQEQISEQA